MESEQVNFRTGGTVKIIKKMIGLVGMGGGLIAMSRTVWAQGLPFAGDQVNSTVNTAGSYLQKLALGFFVILLIIAGLMLPSDRRTGVGLLWGSLAGIAITILAPVLVKVVQGWTGGFLGF